MIAGCEKLLNWSVNIANITMTAMKNADITAIISSLLASFSHPAVKDIQFGNLYVFAYATNWA